jgi:hypothetical protein
MGIDCRVYELMDKQTPQAIKRLARVILSLPISEHLSWVALISPQIRSNFCELPLSKLSDEELLAERKKRGWEARQ